MRLSNYNFQVKYKAGRLHTNADGLSRAHTSPSLDMPAPYASAIESAVWDSSPEALESALDALASDAYLDGFDVEAVEVPLPPLPVTQGPRQLLLESAHCAACHQNFGHNEARSVVCDRCNTPYHLRCTKLKRVPDTYWYCVLCTKHIASRGIQCPCEDLEL